MSDLAISLLILIAFATGLSTGYYCGHAKGRIATLADLQRVSKSLAEGMSVGEAQEAAAHYWNSQLSPCDRTVEPIEGWIHYAWKPPSGDAVIEIRRAEWAHSRVTSVSDIRRETNVNGLYWRYPTESA